jgi:DNA-binding MarR family transcriptional regulator
MSNTATKKISHNAHRLYQAIHLRPYLLKADLGLYEHRVLEVLAVRMARRTNPGKLTVMDTCFPSLETIADEAICNERTVRRALDKLIDAGFLTKSKIPARKRHTSDARNKYESNRYHVVPEVWDQVESPFGKTAEESTATPATAKVAAPKASDSLDFEVKNAEFPSARVRKNQAAEVDKIAAYLKKHLGAHPTYQQADAKRIMDRCIEDYIEIAGSADYCLEVLRWKIGDDATKGSLAKSTHLGGYLRGCFPRWIEELDGAENEENGDTEADVSSDHMEEPESSAEYIEEDAVGVADLRRLEKQGELAQLLNTALVAIDGWDPTDHEMDAYRWVMSDPKWEKRIREKVPTLVQESGNTQIKYFQLNTQWFVGEYMKAREQVNEEFGL